MKSRSKWSKCSDFVLSLQTELFDRIENERIDSKNPGGLRGVRKRCGPASRKWQQGGGHTCPQGIVKHRENDEGVP